MVTKKQIGHFQLLIFEWFAIHQRDLPWRKTHDPYAVLVSEVMLQQTQVDRVKKYWTDWIERWPTFASLATAPTADVIRAWKGLGYNRRAVNLQRAAQFITDAGGFTHFDTPKKLMTIPGIGHGTAGALMNFVWNIDTPFLEVNLKRIFQRLGYGPETAVGWQSDKDLLKIAEAALPEGAARIWPHALMDFGALACRPGDPWCERCPMGKLVQSRNNKLRRDLKKQPASSAGRESGIMKHGKTTKNKSREIFETTNRYWRGRIVDTLRHHPQLSENQLYNLLPKVSQLKNSRYQSLLVSLKKEGLITARNNCYFLPL